MRNLEQLEALEREATPGPWEVNPTGDIGDYHVGTHDGPVCDCETFDGNDARDARFIAAARNALPALLRVARAAQAWDEHERTRNPNVVSSCWFDKEERLKGELRAALAELEEDDE